ncbi:hypothetical protein GTW51_00930 [Aurantimonas aggregata]|uniref:Uncharacterized protein n=1 Tax=Aurantimonas aggregata TaxID=2047720 RepID=A0A6L9MBQ5_9HYPH|nr:hypothetical protein [Aurantimonas aggregata]NDV85259.1 hypothetical protein [Aurantimonas aggregata]
MILIKAGRRLVRAARSSLGTPHRQRRAQERSKIRASSAVPIARIRRLSLKEK